MKLLSLLPADEYVVINKTILTEVDKKNLINLYEPIIGYGAVSLYLTLWSDLTRHEFMSLDYSHHHLMTILKLDLQTIKINRETLESVGLLKTYVKEGDINNYVYELYSPLSAQEFFSHPIFNVVLYNNIGASEYEILKKQYQKMNTKLEGYTDITVRMKDVFMSSNNIPTFSVQERTTINIDTSGSLDFDLLIETLPKGIFNEKMLNQRLKELLNNLAFIYDIDTLKMCELIRMVIAQKGMLNKDELRKTCRKYYQLNNGGLPTLIYRSQPEYLKNPSGDNSKKGKLIAVFENTTPYDFLKSKYNGVNPTSRDLKLLEGLLIDLELKPAVVNVLIDYTLKINNNKLTNAFVETIAGQWKRAKIETAKDAMDFAEKEYKKKNNSKLPKQSIKKEIEKPEWFDKKIDKTEASNEEQEELKELLKEFR